MRIAIIMLAGLLIPAAASAADAVTGRWKTQDGKAIVEIDRCGAAMCGRIVRILMPTTGPAVDRHNPDPALRKQPVLGLIVLADFKDGGKDWRGRVYNPEEGKTYRAIMSRVAAGVLKVQGCVAFFCKTQHWTLAR